LAAAIRIALSDEADATSLANEFAGRSEAEVRRTNDSWEVLVPADASRDLVSLLERLETWLEERGLTHVRLNVDGTSYCMAPIREP
jgi:hypothetical protein